MEFGSGQVSSATVGIGSSIVGLFIQGSLLSKMFHVGVAVGALSNLTVFRYDFMWMNYW